MDKIEKMQEDNLKELKQELKELQEHYRSAKVRADLYEAQKKQLESALQRNEDLQTLYEQSQAASEKKAEIIKELKLNHEAAYTLYTADQKDMLKLRERERKYRKIINDLLDMI